MGARESSKTAEPRTLRQLRRKQDRVLIMIAKFGTISAAARKAKVDRTAVYRWMRDYPDFELRVREAQDELADRLEEKAIEIATDAKKPDGEMLRFLLKGNRPEKFDRNKAGDVNIYSQTNINLGDGGAMGVGPERQAMLTRLRSMILGAYPEAAAATPADAAPALPMIDQESDVDG